jgi:hypothetical protein
MSARQELDSYIRQLERRVRLATLSRGAAILASAALGATVVLVILANARAFSEGSVVGARLVLACILAFAASLGLAIPITRLSRRRAVGKAEAMFPELQQRLVTYTERGDAEPFVELLAADTLDVARYAPPAALAPTAKLLAVLGTGIAAVGVLLWLIVAGPGFLGYGTHLLWTGSPRGQAPLYDLQISPGDATVRRHADQLVTAQTVGLLSPRVVLYARYQSTSKWEPVTMQPRSGASGYQFVFTSVPENVEYYVEAGARSSPHFNIRVVDLPSVKQIKVTYHYPSWTGLKDLIEERGGDLRALEGTRADLEVVTDRPLRDGLLVLDKGQQVRLSGGENNRYSGAIQVEHDGAYHVAGLDQGQAVRLSEDFFIEARKAGSPTVSISRPGGDYRASPIEEVTVAVRAEDEFGLKDLDLTYSVNGGPEKSVRLLKRPDEKQASGSSVIALEDYKLVPGDLVSVYATAKNARTETHTDMLFVQVDPFEREFSQSQQAGGGGGGGGGGGQQADPGEISRREKEIVAATFKQLGDKKATERQAAETAKFLSDVQATLRNQSLSLAGRLEARELTRENKEFSAFQQEMAAAAEAMNPASQKLQVRKWQDAIPDEQKALQHLLRAEATFRQIEVAFGSRGGGGGGGSAGRDLASLFDLELDTAKNQYETQQTASSSDKRAEDMNDALKKLDELARRQEALAQRQRDSAQSFEQRWQQEMLQREAERLQQQLEQLAQNGKQSGQQASGQGGSAGQSDSQESTQSTQSGQSGQSGQPQSAASARARAAQQAAQQALDRLRQAQEDMRRASSGPQTPADARLAAQRLREASSLLAGAQSQEATDRVGSMAREADRMAGEEKDQADRVKKLKERSPGATPSAARDVQQLSADRQRMADDLSKLEQNMRNAARELDAGQRAASDKLRSALESVDQADLETRLQRTADWLRGGFDPNTNGTEAQIASGLQRLSDDLHQAQQALVAGSQRQVPQSADAALNSLERLRRQIESLGGQNAGRQPGQGEQNYQPGQLSRNGQPANGQNGQNGQSGQNPQSGQDGGQGAQGAQRAQGGSQVGPGGRAGNIGPGGRLAPGGGTNPDYSLDTGNNARPGSRTAAAPQSTPAGDPQQVIQQGLSELNQLRRDTSSDPEVQRQIQELITAMEHLDLRRFPGNPVMVEELHQRLLSGVDTLELRLRRDGDDKKPGQIRSTDPTTVPPGYKDAVADYFRRLSATTAGGNRDK